MSTTTAATPAVPAGDICPPWCGGGHVVDRDGSTHEDDRGSFHDGDQLESWLPAEAGTPIEVWIHGFRHDKGDDWADAVIATHADPGGIGGVQLQSADARRLGEALIYGATIIDASQDQVSASGGHLWWCSGGDDDHDHAADAGSEQWPTIRPSAFSTQDMTLTAFPTWAVSEGTPPDVSMWVQYRQRGVSGGPDEIEAAMTPDEALALAHQLIRAAHAAKVAAR